MRECFKNLPKYACRSTRRRFRGMACTHSAPADGGEPQGRPAGSAGGMMRARCSDSTPPHEEGLNGGIVAYRHGARWSLRGGERKRNSFWGRSVQLLRIFSNLRTCPVDL